MTIEQREELVFSRRRRLAMLVTVAMLVVANITFLQIWFA